MSGNHVLVVEENTDRREKLSTLIEFVNCRPVVVDDPTIWFDQVDNLSDIVMAIIGDCGNHHITRQLLRELVNHESRVPVFTLDLPDSDMQEFPGTIGSLRFPIKYPQLSNALQQATIYRGQTHHDQDDNSLFRSLVGNSRSIKMVQRMIDQVADSDANVLILGESGTGKELVARAIHQQSKRAKAPLICVNCAAIPETLIESELFGHEKGAFTGASAARTGLVEAADGGTLFLDEIGELPLDAQARLLRVLQEGEIRKIGSVETRHVDVRLIAATHRDLRALSKSGEFRLDLYYRLNVMQIALPPLREREDDVLKIADILLEKACKRHERPGLRLSRAARQDLRDYPWPGNVRELRNAVQRIYLVCSGPVVTVKDLPPELRDDFDESEADSLESILSGNSGDLESIEASAIRRTIAAEKGNLTRVAAVLGISRPTLYRKMRQYRIDRSVGRPD